MNNSGTMDPGRRVLFILLRAMGDVLLATPAIHSFTKSFPNVELDVLVEKIPAQPLQNNPHIREIIVAPNRGSPLPKFLPLIKTLRSNHYDTVVDFQSTPGSALLTRLTGAPHRIGFSRRYRSWAFHLPVTPDNAANYASLPKFRLLAPFGIVPPSPTDLRACLPELFVSEKETAVAENFLRENHLSDEIPLIGLAPYCRREWRMWAVANWVKLLKSFSGLRQANWLLFAAPNEREVLREIEDITGVRVIWAGQDHLLKAAALMQRCRAVVGGENGLLHLAVAAEVPTFTVFCGRDEPRRWVPPGMSLHAALDLRGSETTDPSDVALMLDMFINTNTNTNAS